MMSLAEEYHAQSTWRNWGSYLDHLPIKWTDTILDLGCGIGTMTNLLSKKAQRVIGIDTNPELINAAIEAGWLDSHCRNG
jgi:tRNA/tmRNA/rRNA uracil-C5-methylase (TrmA/RlmC/RlmD family)